MSSVQTVLGIDPATTTGWVVLCGEVISAHGTHCMKTGRHDSKGMAFLRLERWLVELLDMVAPDMVAFETVARHLGVHAAHQYGGIVAHVMRLCDERDIPYCGVPVGVWKKMATGKGNASKELVRTAFLGGVWVPGIADDAGQWTQDEIDSYYVALAAARGLV